MSNTDTVEFTNTQHLVIGQIALGKSNEAIAEALGIAVKTVKAHLTAIYKAAGVKSCREFLVWYFTQESL